MIDFKSQLIGLIFLPTLLYHHSTRYPPPPTPSTPFSVHRPPSCTRRLLCQPNSRDHNFALCALVCALLTPSPPLTSPLLPPPALPSPSLPPPFPLPSPSHFPLSIPSQFSLLNFLSNPIFLPLLLLPPLLFLLFPIPYPFFSRLLPFPY